MSTSLQMRENSIEELQTIGQVFVKSGFFAETRDAAQAIVKIMAGAELGFPKIASMTGVYIVKGKVSLSANLMAAAVKRSGKYNYRVRQLDDKACKIEFFEDGESVGFSEFTRADAQNAGLAGSDTYKKFFRNMSFARAMSNGAKWYCPDIFGGPIYTPEELGATVDGETGEVIEMPVEPPVWAGMAHHEDDEPEPIRNVDDLVTPKQLWMMRNLARELNVDPDVACDRDYGCKLEELDKKTASALIETLQARAKDGLVAGSVRNVKLDGAQPTSPAAILRGHCRKLGFDDAQLLKWLTKKYGLRTDLTLALALDSLGDGEMSQAIDIFRERLENGGKK